MQYKTGNLNAGNKKTKTEPDIGDPVEKENIVKQLVERDESILVLRKLLADRSATSNKPTSEADENQTRPPASPVKKPNYKELPVERLRQLDKARDATIAWILKQIDCVESATVKPSEGSET